LKITLIASWVQAKKNYLCTPKEKNGPVAQLDRAAAF
jgi:hypothetical protein